MIVVLVIVVLFGAIAAPEFTSSSVIASLHLCAQTIIPSLFIYMVLSDFLLKKNALRLIGRAFSGLGRVSGIGSEGIAVWLLGLLCGAPVGAKLSSQLFERGELPKENAEYLNLFSNNASLSFIFGVVPLTVGRRGAWIVFFSVLLSSIINAFLFRLFIKVKKVQPLIKTAVPSGARKIYHFTESIGSSAQAMLGICASVVLFGFFGDIAEVLGQHLSIFPEGIKGFFEFSSGVISSTSVPLTAFYCCFGGLAVFGQVKTVIGASLDSKLYLPAKLTQGLSGFLIALLLEKIIL